MPHHLSKPGPRPVADKSPGAILLRFRSPVGFIGFVAATKVERSITARDRPFQSRQRDEPTGFILQHAGINAALISVHDPVSCQMVFGCDGSAVKFEPMEMETSCTK